MNLGLFALAVTIGCIIGMTCVYWREYKLRDAAERKLARFERKRDRFGKFLRNRKER